MNVKEKAKAFEGRSSVIGESPPPKKKSREERIGGSGNDDLERESSSETPEPPPRKSKKNGKIKSSEEYSPSLERKENIPTSVKDTKGRQKPPRPPPPPRGSSLGRKSELLSNLRLQSSGEKKKKPPVPPKPKNHIPKKAYVKKNISVKSVKKIVSQPAKDGSVLVPKSSTNSAHESQFFAPLDKDTSKVASSENHESKRSSQFFVSLEEQTSSKDSLNTKELDNSKGHIVFEYASEDSEFSNVENGFVGSNGIHENGVASRPLVIQPGNINFEKDMADPLEGLEITVDDISDDDDISSMPPEGKNEVGEFSEPMEVSVDDASNDGVCNEFQPVDGVEEPEDKVHILYSVELEEECSVTVIENNTRSDEKGTKMLEVQGGIRAENNEVIEVGKGESIASNLLSENLVGENASLTSDEVEKDKMEEEISVVNFFNHQEEMASNFEAEERVDSVLENLSEDSEEILMKEDSPVDEVQELSVNQNVKCETELESSQICVDSTGQNKVENVTDKSHEAAMEEAQQNESQQNGEVIMAEPIREGTLLSVTDRVIFKEISHVDEDKNNSEEPAEEKLEDVRNEDHSGFKGQHENEGFMEKNELEFVSTKPEELESCQDMAVELDKTEQFGEQLLENSIPENFHQKERKGGQMEFVCTSGNEEEPKVEEDVSSLENTEGLIHKERDDQDESTVIPDSIEEDLDTVSSEFVNVEQAASQENVEAVLFEMKEDQDKSTVNAIPNLKEDIETASSEFVDVEQPPSKANKEVVQVEVEEVESSCIVNAISVSTEEDLETAPSEFVDVEQPPSQANKKVMQGEVEEGDNVSIVNTISISREEDLETASSEFVDVDQPPSQAIKEVVQGEVKEGESPCIVNTISISTEEDLETASSEFVDVEQPPSQADKEIMQVEVEECENASIVNAISISREEDLETASSEFVDVKQPPSQANKEIVQVEVEEGENVCIVNAISISTVEDPETASSEFANVEQPPTQENVDGNNSLSPESQPVPPERRSRKAKKQKHVYENIAATSRQLEQIKIKGDSLRKTQSFSKYETASLSISRPVQRVSDDEVIYRVPAKVIPVESFGTDESEYSVPLPISSRARSVTMQDEYAVPKSIIVKACAVTDSHGADDREIYSVPGQVTPVPVVEKFSDSSSRLPSQAVPQEDDDSEYAVPVQAKPVMSAPVSATPPPKPPRTSLLKEEFNVFASVEETSSSASTETETRQSPKPVPRTRELKNSPTPVPRKSSKTAASSESSTTHSSENSPSPVPRKNSKLVMSTDSSSTNSGDNSPTPVPRKSLKIASSTESTSTQSSDSPVPVPRTRLNALQPEPSISNESSSELSTLSSSDISTVETTEEEQTLKRKPPPRPPPPSSRTSIINNENEAPPLTPGPFANEADSDTDSDVGEEASSKGPSKSKTYYIAHEILSTEQTFVDALKLVFEECYGTIKQANVVADSTLGDIFCDLENIYLLDSRFLQELEERMKTWEEHERIGDIIKKYSHFLKMYTQFVNGYDKAIGVFQDTMKENSEFADMVAKFQASERCHGMALSSYMLKPVQRIPSYRLLLIDYLKHLPKDSEESKDTEAALKIVSEVATHINESMKKMESFEQMLKVQRSLVGHPEIVKAGRDFIKEGTLMKLCRKDMQERMFFLLTDVLLYTTPVGGNQYKLNKTLPLLGMQVTVPDSPDFVNEFSIISTTRSFTLTASTPEERDQWVETLNNAIDVVTKRKITFFNKTRDATGLGVQERDEEVMKLGEKAPVWIPDHRVTMCMSCTSPFTLTNRRHHCRACGNVVCGACSESTAPLAYLEYNQARVCDKCYDLLLKDFHTVEMKAVEEESPTSTLPPLLQEAEDAEKLLRKPTKFEMMRRFKSRKTKRKSTIMHPSHLTEVVANQEGSQMSGYLKYKKGKFGWKKSWFVLKDNVLYSYKASSDVVALESQPVLSYEIEDLGKEGNDFVFQLKHHGISPLVFKADNENSATRWIRELKKATKMQS